MDSEGSTAGNGKTPFDADDASTYCAICGGAGGVHCDDEWTPCPFCNDGIPDKERLERYFFDSEELERVATILCPLAPDGADYVSESALAELAIAEIGAMRAKADSLAAERDAAANRTAELEALLRRLVAAFDEAYVPRPVNQHATEARRRVNGAIEEIRAIIGAGK